MWAVSRSIYLTALVVLSVLDMKHRKVPGKLLLAGIVYALIYQFVYRPYSLWILGAGLDGRDFVSIDQ